QRQSAANRHADHRRPYVHGIPGRHAVTGAALNRKEKSHMNLHDIWRNVLRGRARALPAAATLLLLLLLSGGALQAAPPPPCFQQAANLGVLLNNIQVCWNDFTGEFELYFNPQTGIVTGGGCGSGGITALAITGGTVFNPANL